MIDEPCVGERGERESVEGGRETRACVCACAELCRMWRFAIEELRSRRLPVEPELMFETECPILQLVSSHFEVSNHGFSTTIMASFFHPDFLTQNLSAVDRLKLHYYVYFGPHQTVYNAYRGATPSAPSTPSTPSPHLHVSVPPSPEHSPAPPVPPTAITPPPHNPTRPAKRRKPSPTPVDSHSSHSSHALPPDAARAASAWADGVHGVEILREAEEQPLLGT